LGHPNTSLTQKLYGRYMPNAEELYWAALAREGGRDAPHPILVTESSDSEP
jgi:hypothetical protein